jgi:hypothetical protein
MAATTDKLALYNAWVQMFNNLHGSYNYVEGLSAAHCLYRAAHGGTDCRYNELVDWVDAELKGVTRTIRITRSSFVRELRVDDMLDVLEWQTDPHTNITVFTCKNLGELRIPVSHYRFAKRISL